MMILQSRNSIWLRVLRTADSLVLANYGVEDALMPGLVRWGIRCEKAG